jgi:ArsR family transcriptional regulator
VSSKTEISAAIREDLERSGGFDGLVARVPPEETIREQSRIHHALSDPLRLTILHLLKDQPLCVCVIKSVVRIADSRLSYHLNILKEGGLIAAEQQGNWNIYRITDEGRRHAGD